jgi:leader peptidase (prepilin peptidase)/N-methyltransferase
MVFILFILGLAIGSFLNVVALRYDPEKNMFALGPVSGRSFCPGCRRTLRWFELIPLVSYICLLAKCRTCRVPISLRYPAVEIVSGLIALLPLYFYDRWVIAAMPVAPVWYMALSVIFALAFYLLLLITLIDLRHTIIPDEANVAIALLGAAKIGVLYAYDQFNLTVGTFLEGYGWLLGLRDSVFTNHLAAAIFGALFFGIIIYITRGRGMGMGDLKLAAALGLLLGWPDIALAVVLSFILGSLWSLPLLVSGRLKLRAAIPFGPFIALGAVATIFFGSDLLRYYFIVFNLTP